MAKLDDQFYINMLSLSREEAALLLGMLLSFETLSDQDLKTMASNIGIEGDARLIINKLGIRIDDNWEQMKQLTHSIYKA